MPKSRQAIVYLVFLCRVHSRPYLLGTARSDAANNLMEEKWMILQTRACPDEAAQDGLARPYGTKKKSHIRIDMGQAHKGGHRKLWTPPYSH